MSMKARQITEHGVPEVLVLRCSAAVSPSPVFYLGDIDQMSDTISQLATSVVEGRLVPLAGPAYLLG